MSAETFIVGDVHGCLEEFKDLLNKAGASISRHRILLVGDAINKGPYSFEMLKFIRDEDLEIVIGNHELRFINGIALNQAMSPQLKELKSKMGSDLENWLQWIKSWPAYIEDDDFMLVHGGLQPGKHPKDTDLDILVTIRTWDGEGKQLYHPQDPAWHDLYKGDKLVVYGHWAIQGLKIKENSIGLDSGCVYGRELSGAWVESKEIVQVPARKIYCPKK